MRVKEKCCVVLWSLELGLLLCYQPSHLVSSYRCASWWSEQISKPFFWGISYTSKNVPSAPFRLPWLPFCLRILILVVDGIFSSGLVDLLADLHPWERPCRTGLIATTRRIVTYLARHTCKRACGLGSQCRPNECIFGSGKPQSGFRVGGHMG